MDGGTRPIGNTPPVASDRLSRTPPPIGYNSDHTGFRQARQHSDNRPAHSQYAFDQLRHYAAGVPTTSIALIPALATVGRGVPSRLHPPLEAQVRLIAQAAVLIDIEDDRHRVNQAAEAALASLVSAPAFP